MELTATLQKNYPLVKSSHDHNPQSESYCVGGALCLHLENQGDLPTNYDDAYNFPRPATLVKALVKANPDLLIEEAHIYAKTIIKHNDAGNFDLAWAALDEALGWMTS